MTTVMKYELTDASMVNDWGVTLYQIRAIEDISRGGIKKGDLGGWVESVELSNGHPRICQDAWVAGDAQIIGNARVLDNAWVSGNALISGNAQISDEAQVSDGAWISGDARVFGNAHIFDKAHVFGNAQVSGRARIFGEAEISGNAWVCGKARLRDGLVHSGDSPVYGEAWISGDAQVFGEARIFGNARIEHFWQLLILAPIGSEDATACLYRTKDNRHELVIDCWTGTLDTLMDEVERRRTSWEGDAAMHELWVTQYEALLALGKATVARWAETPTDSTPTATT